MEKNNNLRVFNTRVKSFEVYGLNKFKNFLSAPPCDCGCGGKLQPIFKTPTDLHVFIYNMLAENECGCCAIFAHGLDNKMYAGIKICEDPDYDYYDDNNIESEDNPIHIFGIDETDYDYFKMIDADLVLHCYGLLIENIDHSWSIVEE